MGYGCYSSNYFPPFALKTDNLPLQTTQTSNWKRTSAELTVLKHRRGECCEDRAVQPWLWRNFHLPWIELGIQIPSKLLGYQYNKDKCLPVKSIAFCSLHLSAKVLLFHHEDFILRICQDEKYLKDDGLFSFDISGQVSPSKRDIFFQIKTDRNKM